MSSKTRKVRQLRHALVAEQKSRCPYCKRTFGKKGTPLGATIEHLKARMDGGTDRRDNLIAVCLHCNQHRGHQMNQARQKRRQATGA